ncbi:MAG: phosphatase PAP2 family protein [Coriobacteriia bacterium]
MAKAPHARMSTPRSRFAWRSCKGLTLLVISGFTSYYSSAYIARAFPDRPTPRDFLFETLPYVDATQHMNDLALLSALILLFGYALLRAREELPHMLGIFGVMYLLRSVIMLLTPLASAHGNGAEYGVMSLLDLFLVQNGMFPSGHSAAALLCFLLVDPERAPRLRLLQLALAFVTWITLLLSHGHYSIDVVGGLLLAYFVWREWTIGSLLRPVKRLIAA